jgi:WD40 repeat protein
VITVGQDGSVLFWDTERKVSQFISNGATLARVAGTWLLTGGQDGKVRIWDMNEDEREPMLELNGHDAPLADLAITPSRHRIISADSTGVSRIWYLDQPSLNPAQFQSLTGDWIIARQALDRFVAWNLRAPEPGPLAAFVQALSTAKAAGVDHSSNWMATLHHPDQSAGSLNMRLWNLVDGSKQPVVQRSFQLGPLERFWSWSPHLSVNVTASEAWVTFTGSAIGESRAWTVNLRSEQKPAPLARGERLMEVLPGHPWALTATSVAGASSSVRMQLRSLRDSNASLPITGIASSGYLDGISPDATWLSVSADLRTYLLEFRNGENLQPPLRAYDAGRSYAVALGKGQPPIWVDTDGRLKALLKKDEGQEVTRLSLPGVHLTAVAWDTAGTLLGLADDRRHVWLLPDANVSSADTLTRQITSLLQAPGLPMPADTAVSAAVERLFLFPEFGWLAATTDNDGLLLWNRSASGDWSAPLLFAASEFRLDHISRVEPAANGRRFLIGNSEATAVLSFDPAELLITARSLQSGRVR